jgi:hypothetical protein
MAQKVLNGYSCSVCGHVYPSPSHADACRDSHQLLYIPMSKTELNRLVNAIMLGDFELVPFHLLETLRKYARKASLDTGEKV